MLEAVDHTHQNGFVHRDIKPENFMLDQDKKTVKLIDFGFAVLHEDGFVCDYLGTENFMAPEIHLRKPYGKAVDVFALAVSLFIMVLGHKPFQNTQRSNIEYRCLTMNKADLFWKYHCNSKKTTETISLSEEFKDLIEKMMKGQPGERI